MNPVTRVTGAYQAFTKGGKGFSTPPVTPIQQVALGQAIVAVLIAFGFDVGEDMQQLILLLAAALGIGLPASDAVIRQGRAKGVAELSAVQEATERQQAAPQVSLAERERLILLRDRLEAVDPQS